MPKSKEQYEEMRLKSKSAILDAAMRLFVTKGYHATTTSAIAKEAGVAMGLMYHYFNSKEDLLISILEEHLDDLMKSAAGRIDFQKTPGLTEVRAVIEALFHAISQRSDSWKLIITIMFQQDVSTGARHLVENLLVHQNGLYEAYFQGIGAPHPKESAQTVTAVIHGAILSFAMTGETEEFQLVKEHVLEKLLISGV
jgi:AcrR family transcriptional regulator